MVIVGTHMDMIKDQQQAKRLEDLADRLYGDNNRKDYPKVSPLFCMQHWRCECMYMYIRLTLPSNQSFYRLIAGFGMGVADCGRPIVRGAHRPPN